MPAKQIRISVPFYKQLRKSASWTRHPDNPHRYEVVRLHFLLNYLGEAEEPFHGGVLDEITAPEGVSRQTVRASSTSYVIVREEESFREFLFSDSRTQSFAQSFLAKLGPAPDFGISVEDRRTISRTLQEEMKAGERQKRAITYTRTGSFSDTITVNAEQGSRLYVVECYRRRNYELFLCFVDHLRVEYSILSKHHRRPRRVKLPLAQPARGRWREVAPNIAEFNIPLARIGYHVRMPQSFPAVLASEYQRHVPDPSALILTEPLSYDPWPDRLPAENVASLYDLAENAFRFKLPRADYARL